MSMVVVGGLIIAATFFWMNRQVVPLVEVRAPKKKKKAKMSVGESFKFLLKSRYIRDLATLVWLILLSFYLHSSRLLSIVTFGVTHTQLLY